MRYRSAFCFCILLSMYVAGVVAEPHNKVTAWLTTQDRSSLLAKQRGTLRFHKAGSQAGPTVASIEIEDTRAMQTVDGFGFALTGGSAELMMRMDRVARSALIKELFRDDGKSIGVSYLRVSVGASDMNDHVYSYDDMPAGQDDPTLAHFSLQPDAMTVIPVLREILHVNPRIKILASPWSAPAWMKTNGEVKGGSLKPADYDVYALYLARYIEAMKTFGIAIDAMTMQNEPLNPKNTPSMVMQADEQDMFLKQSLGPLLKKRGISTKVILYDHNCDRPDYPMSILADPEAAQYADGSGFHLYGGQTSAMTEVHDAYPAKNIYFTEQMVIDRAGEPGLAIAKPEEKVVLGALANWSRNVLLWNLAADPKNGPHTSNGGCPVCEGAVTLDGNTVTRNLAYYTIAHASKFIRPDSVRVASNVTEGAGLTDVAFKTAKGGFALIVVNSGPVETKFEVHFHGEVVSASLPAGAVATYVW